MRYLLTTDAAFVAGGLMRWTPSFKKVPRGFATNARLIDQLSGLECLMRWALLFFGSLATGVVAIVLSLALLLVSLAIYDRYILGITSNGSVGWDPVSIFGRWVIGIPLLIFGLGCSAGFWFLSKRLHR